MLSIDTNILFYALNGDSPRNETARSFLLSVQENDRVVLSELVLVELYGLLRNPAASPRPLSAAHAAEVVSRLRNHPKWRLVGFTLTSRGLHDRLWLHAAQPNFAFRRIYDARLALTLLDHGVTEFATANVRDFEGLGFEKVWNPLLSQET